MARFSVAGGPVRQAEQVLSGFMLRPAWATPHRGPAHRVVRARTVRLAQA